MAEVEQSGTGKEGPDDVDIEIITEMFDEDGPDHWFDHCSRTDH